MPTPPPRTRLSRNNYWAAFSFCRSGVWPPGAAVRPAMWGSDFAKADLLLGRALGRVVAHELFHMLSRSNAHAREGLARESLTGQQLIAPVLQFTPADFDRIYTLP